MLDKEKDKACSDDLLKKYYQNSCSPEEREYVEQCFVSLEHYGTYSKAARQQWNETSNEGSDKGILQDILHKIHFDMRLEEFRKSNQKKWLKRARSTFLWISAAVLFPLIILNIWQWKNTIGESKTVFTEITAPNGSRVQFNLPDGSSGWLNGGSSLEFPVRFSNRERLVRLNGEGYFNVIKDPKRDFVVHTENSMIRALGTSFNVMAYTDYNAIEEVTLESGTVRIERTMKDGSIKQVMVLKPGQHIQMDHLANSIKSSQDGTEKYTAWKDGKLIFRNDPLERVIMNLERHFNVEIQVADESLNKYHFHATFEDETLQETLRLLKLSSAIDYKILPREKNVEGRYEKQRIILFHKIN